MISVSNAKWSGELKGCGHVIWEKKEEGKCLEGVEVYTIKMEMEEAEEAYNALAEYYRKNFNATVTEYKEDKYKHLNCSIYDDIIVTIFLTETPYNLQDCEFAVMFARY